MPKGKHSNHRRGMDHPKYKARDKARGTKLYRLWLNIRNRCNNTRSPDYSYYGGKGVKVCERWGDFDVFAADVGEPPSPDLTLDRIDGAKGYEPGNVRWATRQLQSRNRAYCRVDMQVAEAIRQKYTLGKTQVALAGEFGVSQATVSKIVRREVWT